MTIETRLLQVCIFLAASVAVLAGLGGALEGARFFALTGDLSASSNVHYLSGLLFAIGLAYWSMIPGIVRNTERFRTLSAIVICGGLFRFLAIFTHGMPHGWALFGLANETLVPTALLIWQAGIVKRTATP